MIWVRNTARERGLDRAIREASTLFSFGHAGVYDHEDDATYMERDEVSMVDVGDVDIVHTDTSRSHGNTELAVRSILASGCSAGTMP
jgi:agmatinase